MYKFNGTDGDSSSITPMCSLCTTSLDDGGPNAASSSNQEAEVQEDRGLEARRQQGDLEEEDPNGDPEDVDKQRVAYSPELPSREEIESPENQEQL